MPEPKQSIKLAFVNPMSVDNLALYDISLLGSVYKEAPQAVIRYYGNKDINQKIPDRIGFIGIYRYRNHSVITKAISYLFSQIQLVGELVRFRPDIIHMQWPKLPIIDRFVWRFLKRKLHLTVFIHTSHNVLPHDAPVTAARFWRPIYRAMDGIIVHHNSSIDKLVHDFQVSRESVTVIPHGPLRFSVNRELLENKVRDIRLQIGKKLPPEKPVIAFLGYLRHYKGPDIFIEAIRDPEIRNLAHFLIVGKGPLPLRLQNTDVFDIIVINAKIKLDEFLAYLNAADLIVMPYRSISQSGLLMTTVAEGVPVLVSDRGGMPDVVRNHNAGWILDSLDITSIRKSLAALLIDPSALYRARRSMDTAALKRLEREWDTIGSMTAEFYKNIRDSSYNKNLENQSPRMNVSPHTKPGMQ